MYDELDSFPNHSIESSYYSVRNSFLDHTANSSSHRDLTHCLSWQLVTVFIEGRMRLNGNKAKELGLFSEDFKMYSEDIVMQNQEHTKEREKLVSEFKAATEERERLLKDISRTMENIDLLTKEIQKNKVKRGEGVELILKTEF